MDRAFLSGASASAPTPPASPSIGYATEGNPGTGTPPTKPGAWWYHMMTEELRALVVAAGITPSQTDLSQLLQALPGALASRPEMARSLASQGYQKLPGGLILQWGFANASVAGSAVTFPIAFTTASYAILTGMASSSENKVYTNAMTATGFTFGSGSVTALHFWLAFGK